MKKSSRRKFYRELNFRFWSLETFIFAVILIMVETAMVLKFKIRFPFLQYGLILTFISILVTLITYQKRTIALSFLFSQIFKALVLAVILLPALMGTHYLVTILTVVLWLTVFLTTLIKKLHNWDETLDSWLKIGKIILPKQRFNILLLPLNYSNKDFKILKITIILGTFLMGIFYRIITYYGGSVELIGIQMILLMLTLIFCMCFADNVALVINILKLQKRKNIVLKTEYEVLIKKEKKRDRWKSEKSF